jgi:hypothetical protein
MQASLIPPQTSFTFGAYTAFAIHSALTRADRRPYAMPRLIAL